MLAQCRVCNDSLQHDACAECTSSHTSTTEKNYHLNKYIYIYLSDAFPLQIKRES